MDREDSTPPPFVSRRPVDLNEHSAGGDDGDREGRAPASAGDEEGEDEGGTANEGRDDHLKDDQKPTDR